jgi:hypothetical protein
VLYISKPYQQTVLSEVDLKLFINNCAAFLGPFVPRFVFEGN